MLINSLKRIPQNKSSILKKILAKNGFLQAYFQFLCLSVLVYIIIMFAVIIQKIAEINKINGKMGLHNPNLNKSVFEQIKINLEPKSP